VDAQQEQIDKLEDINEDTKATTKAGLEHVQDSMWNLCASTEGMDANQKNNNNNKKNNKKKGKQSVKLLSTSIWNACAGQEQDSRSSEDEITISPLTIPHDPTFDKDYGKPTTKTSLASLKEQVQGSAQGAYTIGQALVEDLMEQVEDVARSNNMKSPRQTLQEAQQRWVKHMSCTPEIPPPPQQSSDSSMTTKDNHDGLIHAQPRIYRRRSRRVGEMKE
jgi:hypothetical protein